MLLSSRRGFTLVEVITVVVIVGTLATALYIGTQPYFKRSRDTRRITDINSYMTIIDAYDKNFESFPSNYGSGGSMNLGYCLSELYTRPNYVGFKDKQFQTLTANTTTPPTDPLNLPSIGPCTMTGSFLYSRLDYGIDSQMALIAARLEIADTANYGTGADLILTSKLNAIMASKKGAATNGSPDNLFVIYRLR